MEKLIVIPILLILVLLSLISLSYFYPYIVGISVKLTNEKFYYDLVCFTLVVNVKKPFDCYYLINITGIKILNFTYNISNSFYIYSTHISKNISFNIPNNIANLISNETYVNMTLEIKVTIISSINTKVVRHYQIQGNFTNTYLEYLREAYL
ncbi:hypothetical protein SJAV_10220 [Sulfurisphaera javensis]|uniref:Uncharacterized protein n=1 Tax=Sulfurisphaera javensis TaxID=2049879 RepID=A0AAT9GQ95_9CREN